jgi:hypothetical protein
MEPEFCVAKSPRTFFMPNSDVVVMDYDQLVDTFRKHFRIVSPVEYGLETPIPNPFVPEMN